MAALDGVRVIDASSFLTGPYAALIMGDMGADVIKVEPPERGDPYRRFGRQHRGHGIPFANANRNKRSVALDLTTAEDRDAFERLLADTDVLVTNWRPAVAARLGLDEEVTTRHPRLIWIRITGFGPDGPAADDPAFDSIIQARVGLASTQGRGGPPTLGAAWVCDKTTGLFAAQAALAAIIERHRTGRGRRIDVSMLDTMAYFDFPDVMVERTVLDDAPESPDNRHLSSLRPVRTLDGWIVVNLVRGRHITNAFAALGLHDRQAEVRGITDPARLSAALCDVVETATQHRTTADCLALFASCDVPAGAVLDLDQHLGDPQVAHNRTYVEVDDPNLGRVRRPRMPAAALARDDADQLPPPLLDQHRAAILGG